MIKITDTTKISDIYEDEQQLMYGKYNIQKFVPNQSLSNITNTNINISQSNQFQRNNPANKIQGRHSSQSCSLNATIYAANTLFNELQMINNNKITKVKGLTYTIDNKQGNTIDFSSPTTALNGITRTSNNRIVWVGYFCPDKKGTYTFSAKNMDIWIGDYALRLYNDANKDISAYRTSYDYQVNDIDFSRKYIPIRMIYTGNDSQYNFTFSCSYNSTIISIENNFVTLYNGYNIYYTNQVFFSAVKNDYTGSDNNFDFYIYGKSIDLDGKTVSLDNTQIINDSTSMTQQMGLIKYTYYSDNYKTINIAKGDPKTNRIILTDPLNKNFLLSDKNSLFSYDQRVNFNTYPSSFPLNPTTEDDDINGTRDECKNSCSGNASCKGYYYSTDKDQFSYCTTVDNQKNLTYLPQQPNSNLISSTLYTKNPSIVSTENKNTSFKVVDNLPGYTTAIMPYESYDDNSIPSNTNIAILNNAKKQISNQLKREGLEDRIGNPVPLNSNKHKQIINSDTNSNVNHLGQTYFDTTMNPGLPADRTKSLIFRYPLNSTSMKTNISSYNSIKSSAIIPTSTVPLKNGSTVMKCKTNENIKLPDFQISNKYLTNSKAVSMSLDFNLNITTQNTLQKWDLFNYSGSNTWLRIFVTGAYNNYTLFCDVKSINDTVGRVFQCSFSQYCAINKWNHILAVFTPDNKFKILLNNKQAIGNDLVFPIFTAFNNNVIGSNSILYLGEWGWKWYPQWKWQYIRYRWGWWSWWYGRWVWSGDWNFTPYPSGFTDNCLFSEFRIYNEDITKNSAIIIPHIENFSNMNINTMQSSLFEGFDDPYLIDVSNTIHPKMDLLKQTTDWNSQYTTTLNKQTIDLSNHLYDYYKLQKIQTERQNNNDKINPNVKNGITYKIDVTGNIVPINDNPTMDVIQDDLNQIILQQNTLYITGTLACATLIIAAIVIGRK